jgi:putative transcriptional regulator
MYHYRECGLPNVYLANGYREVETPHGRGISIEDAEGLHLAISRELVDSKPVLSGPEVRFVRKFLDLTQVELAELLGVEDQSVRRWEKLARVPKQADHGVRLVFRDLTRRADTPLPELVRRIAAAAGPRKVHYRFRPRDHGWKPEAAAA